jgi:hypothetical protein
MNAPFSQPSVLFNLNIHKIDVCARAPLYDPTTELGANEITSVPQFDGQESAVQLANKAV